MARLQALDPVTTEVVRLRGAAQHNCRLCKSRRETNALDAGGSEDLYGQIAQFESADDSVRRAQGGVAVRRCADLDAVADQPEVAAGVREHFSEDQAFELTLDVMRNAANKIMVSLGADAPRVEEGTELFLRRRRRADGLSCSVVVEDNVVARSDFAGCVGGWRGSRGPDSRSRVRTGSVYSGGMASCACRMWG